MWRYRRRDRQIHLSTRKFCSTIISSTSMRTRSSRSPYDTDRADVWHARIPCAAHLRSVCVHPRADYCTIFIDWGHVDGARIWFRVRLVLTSLAILVEKGEKILRGSMHSWGGAIHSIGLVLMVYGLAFFCLV